jgi:hypothetical protein
MNNFQKVFFSVISVLFLIGSVLWFNNNYELKDTEKYTGFRGEAKTNHLFAARVFLKRMGIPAEKKDGLFKLPSTNSVILIDTERTTLPQRTLDELMQWVKKGGHLIIRARTPNFKNTDEDDESNHHEDKTDKNKQNEVKLLTNFQPDLFEKALGISLFSSMILEDEDLPVKVQLPECKQALNLNLDFFYPLKSSNKADYQQAYKKKIFWHEQRIENGRISLLANLDFLANSAIDEADHAELLWYLVHRQYEQPQTVWLIHQDDMPPLWQLLWKHAWPFIICMLILIPLSIWAYSPRFGPLQPTPPPHRRRILEHIEASGLFMWKRFTQQHDTHYQSFADAVKQFSRSRNSNEL